MFSLKQIQTQIWQLHFDKAYDLTMHFVRYQECYDSSIFKHKKVQLVDIMDWYSNNFGTDGLFSYPHDWAGFNLPGKYIFKIHNDGIEDMNRYDRIMLGVAELIRAKENNDNFYIIGTSGEDEELKTTFNHELAHGLFFANGEYKQKMTNLVNELPLKTRNFIFKHLEKKGYSSDLFIDECHAYLSTGLMEEFDTKNVQKYIEPFQKTFSEYAGDLKEA